MTGMEQKPSFEANEPNRIIDVRGQQSDDELFRDADLLLESDQQGSMELLLESQAITTATMLSLGLLARECRTAYAIKQEVPGPFWPESQRTLLEIMTHIRDAGYESVFELDLDVNIPDPFLAVYNNLYDQHDSQDHQEFIDFIDAFISKQHKFVTEGHLEFDTYARNLVPFAQFLRSASEVYFLQKFGSPYLENDIVIPDTLVDHALLREFTNSHYWLNIPNEPFIDLTRDNGIDSTARRSIITLHESLGKASLLNSISS